MSIIRTIDLTKKFDSFVANDKINLSVEPQEIKCIVGENGAGKSTLMNMLYGALAPTSGKILINEQEVHFHSPTDAISQGIGMVHQHFKLVPSLTVYENILLGEEMNRTWKGKKLPFVDRNAEIESVKNLIDKFHFQIDPKEKVENLSVGLCQQVEILKMLYRNVSILILDEPTAVLTPQEVDRLMENLKELRANGKTIIVITHKLREVMALCDSVTVIKQGKVIGTVKKADTSERELAQMMVGRDVVLTVKNENAAHCSKNIAYNIQNLCAVNADNKEILHQICFKVYQGEILGIAGVEGNGQSELIKVLTGLMTSTSGRISIGSIDVTNAWPDELRKTGLGIIPEDRYAQGLCKDMSISENCIAGYFSNHGVCKKGILDNEKIEKLTQDYITKYDIRVADSDGLISQLSGGNAQKIIIAREFENHPKLMIACQPTRGVDIGSIEFIHKQLLKFRNEGHAVLLISSELSEIMSLSDRVAVMYKGGIIGEVEPKSVTAEQVGLLMAGAKQEGEEKHEKNC
ncbi:MAG: ABC transporter ATP-binding protein [Lachnospiraceae bacterium]